LLAIKIAFHGLNDHIVFGLAAIKAQLRLLHLQFLDIRIGLGQLEIRDAGPQLGLGLLELTGDLEFEVVGLDTDLGQLFVLAVDIPDFGPPVQRQGKVQIRIHEGDLGTSGT